MKTNLSVFSLRINKNLIDKLSYIAQYEGRSRNKEIEQLIKQRVEQFEKENGEIK